MHLRMLASYIITVNTCVWLFGLCNISPYTRDQDADVRKRHKELLPSQPHNDTANNEFLMGALFE
jgi:hypothetical protein